MCLFIKLFGDGFEILSRQNAVSAADKFNQIEGTQQTAKPAVSRDV